MRLDTIPNHVIIYQSLFFYFYKYYHQNNNTGTLCTVSEMKRFLGILFLSGYSTVPAINDYWSTNPTLGREIVRQSMSRNKFKAIKRYLHLNNNDDLDTENRFSKLQPFFDILNRNFLKFGIFTPHLSIDEEMAPYFGKHPMKMFMRNKPIRFGFKIWCLCSSEGYLYNFYPYGGAGGYDKQIGLGAQVVLRLLSVVENPLLYDIYFDNFFTSYYLMCLLSERFFFATGTVRANRCGGAVLKTGKELPKRSTDYLFDNQNKVLVVRWSDNKEVTLLSNHQTIEPMMFTNRYCKEQKKKVSVEVANVIQQYNKHMGGVDLHDNAVSNYRIGIRGKKWWWSLFVNAMDNAMVNAWKLRCFMDKAVKKTPISQKTFRINVCESLLLTPSEDDVIESVHIEDTSIPKLDGNHLTVKDPNAKILRCKVCHKGTIYMCSKCNIHIHIKCFALYEKH